MTKKPHASLCMPAESPLSFLSNTLRHRSRNLRLHAVNLTCSFYAFLLVNDNPFSLTCRETKVGRGFSKFAQEQMT